MGAGKRSLDATVRSAGPRSFLSRCSAATARCSPPGEPHIRPGTVRRAAHGKVPPGPGDGTVRAAVGRRAAAARPPRRAPGRPPPLPAPPNGQHGRAAPRRCRLWAWAPRHSVRSIPPIVRRWRLDRLTPRGELRFSRQPSAATRPEPRGPAPARGARDHFVSHGLPGRPAASASVGTGQPASCRSDPGRRRLPTGRRADGWGGEQPSGVAALLSGYGAPLDRVVLRLHETPPTRLNRRR